VGVCLKKLNVFVMSRALYAATHDDRMIIKAKVLGEQIRRVSLLLCSPFPATLTNSLQEDGVGTAIQAIYRDLEYAKSLIKHRAHISKEDNLGTNHDEESWTFIGDESDPELQRRIKDWPGWEPGARMHGRDNRYQGAGRESLDLGA